MGALDVYRKVRPAQADSDEGVDWDEDGLEEWGREAVGSV